MKLVDPFPDRYWNVTTATPTAWAGVPRRIGLLDNSKGTADVLLDEVRDHLDKSLGAPTHPYRKEWFSRPAPEHLFQTLQNECDLVITAVGD